MAAKAINTRYAGHLFRSRLEARWAVFMDALGWQWDYEPEGFDLPHTGLYLPDFLVLNTGAIDLPCPFWAEVKGTAPSIAEINSLRELCCETNLPGTFLLGSNVNPPAPWMRCGAGRDATPVLKLLANHKPVIPELAQFIDAPFRYGQVPTTVFAPATEEWTTTMRQEPTEIQEPWQQELSQGLQRWWGELTVDLYAAAARKALSARFEHGAVGGI